MIAIALVMVFQVTQQCVYSDTLPKFSDSPPRSFIMLKIVPQTPPKKKKRRRRGRILRNDCICFQFGLSFLLGSLLAVLFFFCITIWVTRWM